MMKVFESNMNIVYILFKKREIFFLNYSNLAMQEL